jgi:hypothetical protein
VTLLLFNSLANEALPIFLAELVPGYVAVALSVTMILVFGEIIPSAVFTGRSFARQIWITILKKGASGRRSTFLQMKRAKHLQVSCPDLLRWLEVVP